MVRRLTALISALTAGVLTAVPGGAHAAGGSPTGAPLNVLTPEDLMNTWVLADTRLSVAITDYTATTPRTYAIDILRADMRSRTQPSWHRHLDAIPATTFDIAVAPGQVVCVRARAVDAPDSAWSMKRCAVRPIDDRRLQRSGRMRTVKRAEFADGRARRLAPGARLRAHRVPRGWQYGFVVGGGHVGGRFEWPWVRQAGNLQQTYEMASDPVQGQSFQFKTANRDSRAIVQGADTDSGYFSKPVGGFAMRPDWAATP
ncbi:MAG TPA: hypothetical protein VGE38_02545 [Nocardioides sp.]|uniref:hypothetical protein n=1 Tax=Nocardioides sp. TaxID=35761 RepID=UPI002ED92AD7